MDKATAEAAYKKCGTYANAARSLGVAKSTVIRAINGRTDRAPGKASPAPERKGKSLAEFPKRGKSLAEFRAQYDKATIIPARVRAGLKTIGAQGWEYEVQFAKIAGVSLADLGRVRDEFAENHVVTIGRDSRRAWAGSRATAAAMREMLA
jgi:hypothetical protein